MTINFFGGNLTTHQPHVSSQVNPQTN